MNIDYRINYLFIPINFILKRFNYIISFSFKYWFDDKDFTTNIYRSVLSIKKLEKIPNQNFYKIIKEYIIYQKYYERHN
jgi:hypothetical protein